MNLIDLAESGLLPDSLIRHGIRRLLASRLKREQHRQAHLAHSATMKFAQELRQSPLAVGTDDANDQHYEVPTEFFRLVLGPRMKYSCCLYPEATTTLKDAEGEMLSLTCERAEIEDGMDIMDLGCGWGSVTLWIAQHFPNSRITAVSNSNSQRLFIEARCRELDLENVRVITADISELSLDGQFDRVVSVEMFEHLRNYAQLLQRISNWIRTDGKLFVHIFCHRTWPYLFQTAGARDWMGRHFFTGGMMPSEDLLFLFQDDLRIEQHWRVSGHDYWQTCEAWLQNLDANRSAIVKIFESQGEQRRAARQVQRWRIFFLACAELFRYRQGGEWFVCHYLMHKTCDTRLPQRKVPPVEQR